MLEKSMGMTSDSRNKLILDPETIGLGCQREGGVTSDVWGKRCSGPLRAEVLDGKGSVL